MIDKNTLRKEFGYPYTTKKKVRDVMCFKDYSSVAPLFYGLASYKKRYATDDVISRLFAELKYIDE